ncbi:MAG TPA: diguanylate cyclase [Leptospiraceae bacterium]|nr:diguanylate cyclase [Leptospiraceae bacterium]HMZ60644.1 diguanylate cyclase [Leptospiraceae bacterium]HNF15498.1 diguanylate cyclase [Leptospiraceae bacterium]HNH08983.1 diguanylate cyclase [Leptospiraceae bacterium]HNI97241.1 diguanylate cyclase [Leptospiraceae bacterium]
MRKKIVLFFILFLAVLTGLSFFSIYTAQNNEKTWKTANRSFDVMRKLKETDSHLNDLENYKKLYQETGNSEYLYLFEQKLHFFDSFLINQELERDFEDIPEQRTLYDSFLKHFHSIMKCQNPDCSNEKGEDVRHARTLIQKNSDELNRMEVIIIDLEQNEKKNLETNREQHERDLSTITYITFFGSIFSFITSLILFYYVKRDLLLKSLREEELERISYTDELSQLYNRRGFIQKGKVLFEDAKSRKINLYLFYIDMDGLKSINDNFGHSSGDEAIKCVAEILRHSFRLSDVIARLGGDEFAVLVAENNVLPEGISKRLSKKMHEFNERKEKAFKIDFSVGFKSLSNDYMSLEAMLMEADSEMYRHKKDKKVKQEENTEKK